MNDFIDSWSLFAEAYVLGWCLAIFLPLLGILIVIRRQIFIAAAISQSSILGLSCFLSLTYRLDHLHVPELVFMLFASWLASLLCLRSADNSNKDREPITAVVFLLSSALALLLLAHAPLGLEKIQKRMSSSLIGASWNEVYLLVALLIILGLFWKKYHRTIFMVCLEPLSARAMGINVKLWDFLISSLLGLSIGWCIHMSGMLFVFSSLVLPILIAKEWASTMKGTLFLAPIMNLIIVFLGFILSHQYDYPMAQFCVALQGALFFISFIFKNIITTTPS